METKLVKNFSKKTLWSRNVYPAWEFFVLGGCGNEHGKEEKHANTFAKLARKELITPRQKMYLRMMVKEYRRVTKEMRDMY